MKQQPHRASERTKSKQKQNQITHVTFKKWRNWATFPRYVSLLFYVQNKHSWTTGDLFSKCEHPELTKNQIKSKEWPSPNSNAFMVLQDIVTSQTVLNDLKHLTQLLHTVTLGIYHALYNKEAPKSQHFSYIGMVMRGQLEVLDFNSGSGLEQAWKKSGEKKCNLGFIKMWPSKWIKAKKDKFYLKEMVQETIEHAKYLCQSFLFNKVAGWGLQLYY